MSLINEMLRDLEARRAAELGKQDLQREIRPLPETRRGYLPVKGIFLVGGGLALSIAAATWWYATRSPMPQADTGIGMVPPIRQTADPSQPETVSTGAAKTVVSAGVLAAPGSLRPSMSLSISPAAASAKVTNVPDKNKPLAPADVAKPPVAAAANGIQAAKSGNAVSPTSSGSIEKTSSPATPRERAEAEFKRAQILVANGDVAAAQDALAVALKQDAAYTPARRMLLKLMLDARRVDEAIALLQDGLELNPGQPAWAISLARLQVERGDVAGAELTLARSQGYAGHNPEYVGFHGYLLNRLGRFREAVEQYQIAAKSAAGEGRWWFGLGQALEGDGRAQEAKAAFRAALDAGNLSGELSALAEQKLR